MRVAALCALCALWTMAACRDERAAAATAQQLAAASRLTGTWDIRLELEPHTSVRAQRDTVASGTIALLVDHRGLLDSDELRGISNVGVYDLETEKFGWGRDDPTHPSTAMARTLPMTAARGPHDSVDVILSPGSATLSVRMAGILEGDSIRGRWTAESFRTGGGAGRFIMRRRARR